MCHAAMLLRKHSDLGRVHPHGVRKPDVRSHPVQFLHVAHRAVTEALQAELLLVLGLCQVRVKVHAVLPRQLGRSASSVRRSR